MLPHKIKREWKFLASWIHAIVVHEHQNNLKSVSASFGSWACHTTDFSLLHITFGQKVKREWHLLSLHLRYAMWCPLTLGTKIIFSTTSATSVDSFMSVCTVNLFSGTSVNKNNSTDFRHGIDTALIMLVTEQWTQNSFPEHNRRK